MRGVSAGPRGRTKAGTACTAPALETRARGNYPKLTIR